jgi:hypothetical protein
VKSLKVTGRGGLEGCEMLRIPHCLDNRLTDGGKARVFRRDSPPTRSRRSTGSGGESSSMLTSVERNAVQAFAGFYN